MVYACVLVGLCVCVFYVLHMCLWSIWILEGDVWYSALTLCWIPLDKSLTEQVDWWLTASCLNLHSAGAWAYTGHSQLYMDSGDLNCLCVCIESRPVCRSSP